MREIYGEVEALIKKVDFSKLWPGFKEYPFALYNSEEVFFKDSKIPWNQSFIGNTSIEYEGKLMAIWSIEGESETAPEVLAAGIVHEMFHAFQKENSEQRYPNDLKLLMKPFEPEFYELKYCENLCLKQAYEARERAEKKAALADFAQLRKYRLEQYPEATKEENLVETLEGSAEFVGTSALRQLSEERFTRVMCSYLDQLTKLDTSLFDARRKAYFTGTIILHLARDLGLEYSQIIKGEMRSVFELLFPEAEPDNKLYLPRPEIAQLLQDYREILKTELESISQNCYRHELAARICGYDPMNMDRLDEYLICRHFVMLQLESNEQKFLKGPLLLELKEDSPNELKAIYLEQQEEPFA